MPDPRIIISGGGTGGHIFPAIAIADAIKAKVPNVEILFVGAEGRMEMEKVPLAGYNIKGLKIAGLQRRLTVKNLSFPFKLAGSLLKARSIVRDFNPDVAVGVGGYASGPLLRAAAWKKVPTLIQEQNSYPGITNRLLSKAAKKICVAYEGMEKYFPKDKIVLTGNPIRNGFDNVNALRGEAHKFFGLDPQKKTVLSIGGSLGARTINEALSEMTNMFPRDGDRQLLWQSGKQGARLAEKTLAKDQYAIVSHPFINRMDLAYACADVIISRAGAMSISELCVVGKPAILVPSPNVAEDHQTKNARALEQKGAAILVSDKEAPAMLSAELEKLLGDNALCEQLANEIQKMAKTEAAGTIADEVLRIARNK